MDVNSSHLFPVHCPVPRVVNADRNLQSIPMTVFDVSPYVGEVTSFELSCFVETCVAVLDSAVNLTSCLWVCALHHHRVLKSLKIGLIQFPSTLCVQCITLASSLLLLGFLLPDGCLFGFAFVCECGDVVLADTGVTVVDTG